MVFILACFQNACRGRTKYRRTGAGDSDDEAMEVGDAIFLASSKMPTTFKTPDGAETLGVSILGINSVKGLVAAVLEKGSSQIDADIRASSVNMHYTVVGKKRPIKITALTRWADLRVATSVLVTPAVKR